MSPESLAADMDELSFQRANTVSDVVKGVKDANTLTAALASIDIHTPIDKDVESPVPSSEDDKETAAAPAPAIGIPTSADGADSAPPPPNNIPSITTVSETDAAAAQKTPVRTPPLADWVLREIRERDARKARESSRYSPLVHRRGQGKSTRDHVRAIRAASHGLSEDEDRSQSPSPRPTKPSLIHLLNENNVAPGSRETTPSPEYAAVETAAAQRTSGEDHHYGSVSADLADDEDDSGAESNEDEAASARTDARKKNDKRMLLAKIRQKAALARPRGRTAVQKTMKQKVVAAREDTRQRRTGKPKASRRRDDGPPAIFLEYMALHLQEVANRTYTEEERAEVQRMKAEEYASASDDESIEEDEEDEDVSMVTDDAPVACPVLSPASFSDDEDAMDSSEDEFMGPVPGYVDFGSAPRPFSGAATPEFVLLEPGEYAKGGYGAWEAVEEDTTMDGDGAEDAAMGSADAARAGGKFAEYQPMLVGRGALYGGCY
ncbi:hypothetical protein HDZ31DRAFT_77110 [Schizophyllum fasciatum]